MRADVIVLLSPLLALLLLLRVGLVPYVLLQSVGSAFGLLLLPATVFDTTRLFMEYVGLNALFLVGYVLFTAGGVTPSVKRVGITPVDVVRPQRLVAVISIVGALGIYHILYTSPLIRGGNIETVRFDFTSSGFLGIPGRMYLFGIPLCWILATAAASHLDVPPWRHGAWRAATFFYASASLLSGFKSGLIAMLAVMVLTSAAVYNFRPPVISVVRRGAVLVVLATVYAFAIGGLYSSYSQQGVSRTTQFVTRMTEGAALPKAFVLQGQIPGVMGNTVLSDLRYYVPRYTGRQVPGSYATERAVSAAMIGISPRASRFTTPVTIGGFPELKLAFGLGPAAAIAFALGASLRFIEVGQRSWLLGSFLRGAAVFGLSQWIIRGNLAYYLLNIGVVLAAVLLLTAALCRLQSPVPKRADVPAGPPLAEAAPSQT